MAERASARLNVRAPSMLLLCMRISKNFTSPNTPAVEEVETFAIYFPARVLSLSLSVEARTLLAGLDPPQLTAPLGTTGIDLSKGR